MSSRKIAVLGSNSFAGAAFVARALRDGAEVLGINRSPETSATFLPYRTLSQPVRYAFHQADLTKNFDQITSLLDDFQPEVIVDFAGQGMVAESWNAPWQWYETNILSKVKLHHHLRHATWLKRFVRISTPEVYGSHEMPMVESQVYNPSTPYAVSHAAIDMSLMSFHQHYRFPVVIARFANFYGPGQQLYRLIPRAVLSALSGRTLPLHGGGTAVRAFVHADDVSDGIMRAIDRGEPGEIYHFAPERAFTIRQVVEFVSSATGVPFDRFVTTAADRPAKDHCYRMDSSKARTVLGWSDRVDIDTGIRGVSSWVAANMAEMLELPWHYIHKH